MHRGRSRPSPLLATTALAALGLALAAPAQDRWIDRTGSYSLVLPDGWRQITPDEAHTLGQRDPTVPRDLVEPRPVEYYPFGAVDDWMEGHFDGRCLLVAKLEGQVSVDATGVATLAQHAAHIDAETAADRELLSADPVKVGPDDTPAIEVLAKFRPADGGRTTRTLELWVPSGGDTLVFMFRAWEGDFPQAEPSFRASANTLRIARPARPPRDLAQSLIYPAMVGGLVGLLILVLRKRTT